MSAALDDVNSPAPEARFNATEIMEAVVSVPSVYRDAVIAVDVMGMSYKEAARAARPGSDNHEPASP